MKKNTLIPTVMIVASCLVGLEPVAANPKLENVANVALKGGDYSDPAAAMADLAKWCGMLSATNPCLLKIAPGVYDLGGTSLFAEEFVDIEGSGENVTILRGDITTDGLLLPLQGVVAGASNAELRFLTVINAATSGSNAVAISYDHTTPKLLHVTARASGGTSINYGIYIDHASEGSHLRDVTAEAAGGEFASGIRFIDCAPGLFDVTASASEGTVHSYGVVDDNDAGGVPTIENSVISGQTGSVLSRGFGSVHIANTRLDGSVHVAGDPSAPPPVCAGVYNGAFTFFAAICP